MPKKLLGGIGIAALLAVVFLLGSLLLRTSLAQTPSSVDDDAAEATVKGPDMDEVEEQVEEQNEVDEQEPQYTGSILLDDAQYEGMSEADEAAALQGLATISADDAEQAAIDANPGTSVVETELDNENGVLVYSVELSNGNEVKVDAGNAQILHMEAGDLDNED